MIHPVLALPCRFAFWGSDGFYVLLFVLAAAVVYLLARPRQCSPAIQSLAAGCLVCGPVSDVQRLAVSVGDDGTVHLQRSGVEGLTLSGALSIAVERRGRDIVVKERLSPGYAADAPADGASFILPGLPPGRYHVNWSNPDTGWWVAFGLSVRPGMHLELDMKQ